MSQRQWSRRSVLAAGAAGMGVGMLSGVGNGGQNQADAGEPLSATPDAAMHDYKVSIAGYSFRNDLDRPGERRKMSLLDLVDLAARLEIDAVEPTSYYFFKTDDAELYELKRRVFLAGLEISGTPVGNNFCLPPGPKLDEQLALVRTWVDHCVKLGSPAIRIFAGKAVKDRPRHEVFANTVSAMKEASSYAASKGVFLAIENHGFLTETADDLLKLLEAVDNDWLGINLDTGNFHGEPYANIARAAPYAVTCQIKTKVRKPGGQGGRESADYARIVNILREADYRGYLTLEYEGSDPHVEVPIHLQRLQRLARPIGDSPSAAT